MSEQVQWLREHIWLNEPKRFAAIADEIERLNAELDVSRSHGAENALKLARVIADNEKLNESVKKFIAADAECERLEADNERLTAELTHHKGKAEVWEDAARAAQADKAAASVS